MLLSLLDNTRRNDRRLAFGLSAMLYLSLLVPSMAAAEDTGTQTEPPLQEAGERLDLEDAGLVAWKPDGWVKVEPPSGAVLTLLAAGRDRIRLEVRSETGLNDKDKVQFFSSFHAKLMATGFRRLERRDSVQYGSYSGSQTVYQVSSKETPFRLVIWQVGRGKTAWMVVGFFPDARYEHYISVYRRFASALQLSDATEEPADRSETSKTDSTRSGDEP